MTRASVLLAIAVLAPLAGGGAWAASQQSRQRFPHEKHERLFPICQGCHAGVLNGNAEELYPEPADCAQCHDATRAPRIEWTAPGPRESNLRFSHTAHREATDSAGEYPVCQACHTSSQTARRMDVGAPKPARCLECHAHANETHLASTATCRQCHVPLTNAPALAQSRVETFPRPAWHDSADFVLSHGAELGQRSASCQVCHARETCERCHANADRVRLIGRLERDRRVAAFESNRIAKYPTPASHRDPDWTEQHGPRARAATESCANCHTPAGCLGCHGDGAGAARSTIAALPKATGRAAGVGSEQMAGTPHATDIAQRHGALAATGKPDCAQCHAPDFCSSCHVGSDSRAFHATNYVERHAPDVFAARGDCRSCHNTERFCRDCHVSTGVASRGRMNAAFHNAQPMWVLSHGQAARTGLESCASCHRQNDCMRCHSAVGGWGVNPHGQGFAASRLSSRTGATCRLCHPGTPGGGQ